MIKKHLNTSIKNILYATSGIGLCLTSALVASQEDNEVREMEEVLVLGTRQSLETAVAVKRDATAIVDHISADDIGGFPALDLGETLQAIPGIQLNRDSERRQSEVSLRGFSGGFILQTAEGQEFANPTRSQGETSPSPFGAFESSVFTGVTVYKTLQADLIEGGIAGVIDKQLPNALSKSGTGGSVTLGTRYEHLNDSYDPSFQLSGWTHLIEDELAVSFKLAGSDQNFRKDVLVTSNYENIENQWVSPVFGVDSQPQFASYDAYKTSLGIPLDATIIAPNTVRQVSETNDGDRISFTGNIAWQATDELLLDMDLLYTKRNMDQSELEQLLIEGNVVNSIVRPRSNPFLVATKGSVDEDATITDIEEDPTSAFFSEDQYALLDYEFENARVSFDGREFDFLEQTEGVFLGAEWERGALTLESNLTLSSAKNEFVQTLYRNSVRNQELMPGDVGNALNGRISVDGTAYDQLNVRLENASDLPLFDFFSELNTPGRNSGATGAGNHNGASILFILAANSQTVDRDFTSFDLSGVYEVEAPFISSVKAGYRYANDDVVSTFLNHSLEQTAIDLLDSDILLPPTYTTGTTFFNGELNSFVTAEDGWVNFDVDEMNRRLQSRGLTPAEDQVLTGAGFIAKTNPATNQAAQNFTSSQETHALFLMANIEQDIGNMLLTGNVGVRYVDTELTADGVRFEGTGRQTGVPFTDVNTYDHILPSLNLVLAPVDDILVRFAASRGIVRPNLKGLRPAITITPRDRADPDADNVLENDEFGVRLPDFQVEPFTSDNLDLSLEWYNREGSNLGAAVFTKKFKGKFKTNSNMCPATFELLGEDITLARNPNFPERCEITSEFLFDFGTTDDETGEQIGPQRVELLDLSQKVNSDEDELFFGMEFYATQNLDFLPGFWSGFGANVSYTHLENKDDADLYNVSEDSFNVTGYWQGEKLDTRLSWNWRSDYRLDGGGGYQGREERIVEARSQIDLTVAYRVTDDVRVTFQAFNMTDESLKEHDYRNSRMLRRLEYGGRMYALKASYSF